MEQKIRAVLNAMMVEADAVYEQAYAKAMRVPANHRPDCLIAAQNARAAVMIPAITQLLLALPVEETGWQPVSYRVEPERDSPDGGDWHVVTFSDGTQRHILTRHPVVIVEAEKH
jgi:hypothetical protein